MEYAAIIFIGCFAAQALLLFFLRKLVQSSNSNIMQHTILCQSESATDEVYRKIDELDIEIFNSSSHSGAIKSTLKIKCANTDINKFYQKRIESDINFGNLFYCSLLNKSLANVQISGQNIESLKTEVIKLITCQFPDGSAAAYLSGENYICADDAISSAAIVFAVASYVDYSGDTGFLQYELPYNDDAYTDKPIKKIKQVCIFDSVYNHCVAALNYCKNNLNQYLLINSNYTGVVSKIGLFSGYEDVAASLFYCLSAQKFMQYIENYEEKIKLVFLVQEINKNASKKLKVNLDDVCKSQNKLLNAVLYIFCQQWGEQKQIAVKEIAKHVISEKIYSDFYTDDHYLAVLTCLMLYTEHETESANKLFLHLISCSNLKNEVEKIVKYLGIRYYFGLDFKSGHLVFKSKNVPYEAEFNYNGKLVKIICQQDLKGISVDGLLINNLDYINLKGYNKDIVIKLGAK